MPFIYMFWLYDRVSRLGEEESCLRGVMWSIMIYLHYSKRSWSISMVWQNELEETTYQPWLNFDTLLSWSIKIGPEIKYTFDMFLIHQYLIPAPFHTHFIQFRYDFLSSITIWYTVECIKVYLINFWVYQNCIKSESKQCAQF